MIVTLLSPPKQVENADDTVWTERKGKLRRQFRQIQLGHLAAGNAGEFYTPRAVTQFIVEQVNPRLGETILDPACGTGGFLVCAIEHLRKQAKTEAHERTIQTCFSGIEKKHLPHVLCMTNLMLHGIDVPSNVRHDNT